LKEWFAKRAVVYSRSSPIPRQTPGKERNARKIWNGKGFHEN
jgi:hypothetical protein